ncbi:MAG: phosphoribosylamine--glycine ligase [Caldilineaceae bacterium]
MNILIIGSGGREHALAWKMRQSKQVGKIYAAPGNAGIAALPNCELVNISVGDLPALLDFAKKQAIDLTVVGPEAPLVAGIVDEFQAAGLRIFGPSKAAAQLEGSKAYCKEFLLRHHIPTGRSATFSDFDEAVRYLRQLTQVPVIKASGLAAGKGVIIPHNMEEAAIALQEMLLDRKFGAAGDTVLVEEKLIGPELSVLALCDGKTARILPPAQDHKRIFDGDRGPNTGGMGAFSPSPQVTPALLEQVEKEILAPTIAGMAAEGTPFVGVLFVGLMLTRNGPKVLEFNTRFGDPETQVVMPLLETDLIDIFNACIDGNLDKLNLRWRKQAAVTVVMAAHGYPGDYPIGHSIFGIEDAEAVGCIVFHAGTKQRDSQILTNGGRVLAVTALGKTLNAASELAYEGVAKINFSGVQFRSDIGRPLTKKPSSRPRSSRPIKKEQSPRASHTTGRKLTRGKMALKRRGSSKGF